MILLCTICSVCAREITPPKSILCEDGVQPPHCACCGAAQREQQLRGDRLALWGVCLDFWNCQECWIVAESWDGIWYWLLPRLGRIVKSSIQGWQKVVRNPSFDMNFLDLNITFHLISDSWEGIQWLQVLPSIPETAIQFNYRMYSNMTVFHISQQKNCSSLNSMWLRSKH